MTIRMAGGAQVAEQVSKHLDAVDNTCTPCAEVDETVLDYGHVRYRCADARTVTLSNPGNVFVHFRLIGSPHTPFRPRPSLPANLSLPACSRQAGSLALILTLVPLYHTESGAAAAGDEHLGFIRSARPGSPRSGVDGGNVSARDWLTAEPTFGLLMPGAPPSLAPGFTRLQPADLPLVCARAAGARGMDTRCECGLASRLKVCDCNPMLKVCSGCMRLHGGGG